MTEFGDFKYYAGGAGLEPIPATPVAAGPRPANPSFIELTDGGSRQWAVAVAENLVWLAAQSNSLHTISVCWVDTELAVCLHYSGKPDLGGRYGLRVRPEISPISGSLDPARHDSQSGTASKQASNFLDVQMGGGPPDPADVQWIDPQGRRWWGHEPATGWRTVADPSRRLVEIPTASR